MKRTAAITLALTVGGLAVWASTGKWDGGRTIPVHRFPINDENNVDIVPVMPSAMPFSTRTTCGPCHDYGTISSGWHFDSSRSTKLAGRIGEPWVWVDQPTGTLLPLSYRGWQGTWKPDALGVDHWDFTKQFGRHMPGGDMGEPPDPFDDPDARWTVSGRLEINCLGCHNGSALQDHTEWVKQVGRENFRWAGTAASGMGEVGGMAARIWPTWRPSDGPNIDDQTYAVPPFVHYDVKHFDSRNKAIFDIRKPLDQRCLNCHSATRAHAHKIEVDGDVHTLAGLKCVDCHRNGLDHKIIRGYEAEGSEFSCKDCHEQGRLGAPHPEHPGLPPIHFEKLSCTACHSGQMPAATPARIRTSRANRLNIHGIAQWFTDAPFIEEPVFAKGADGKIAPHRLMWPAFWARKDGDKLTPILPADVAAAGAGILDARQQVGTVLKAMAFDPGVGDPVFFSNGKLFRLNVDGGVDLAASWKFWGWEQNGRILPLHLSTISAAAASLPDDEASVNQVLGELVKLRKATRPIYVRESTVYRLDADGRLDTTNTAETATFWGCEQDGKMTALKLDAPDPVTEGNLDILQIGQLLGSLTQLQKLGATVFVRDGEVYRAGDDGSVKATAYNSPLTFWGRERNGTVGTLIPYFDSAQEPMGPVQEAIVNTMKALRQEETLPDAPIMTIGKKRYQLLDGVLTPTEAAEETSGAEWGWMKDGKMVPLVPDEIGRFVLATTGTEQTFNEEQLVLVLRALGPNAVYIGRGRLFSLAADGRVSAVPHMAAEPTYWPLGHDVRPARQSLGIKSCQECHSPSSPFFMGQVKAAGLLQTKFVATKYQYEFQDLDIGFERLFGLSFKFRTTFKVVLWIAIGLLGAILVAFSVAGLRALARFAGGKQS